MRKKKKSIMKKMTNVEKSIDWKICKTSTNWFNLPTKTDIRSLKADSLVPTASAKDDSILR